MAIGDVSMNTRFMCAECGSQPCMCQEFECAVCKGEGQIAVSEGLGFNRGDVDYEPCGECDGEGSIKCKTHSLCPHEATQGTCHCQNAWERQQEDNASEPPMSARERQEIAHQQKRESHR
jgi:hypothetical protein